MNRVMFFAAAAASLSLMSASAFGMTAIKNGATGAAYTNAKSSIDAYNKNPGNASLACKAAIDPLGISDFQITITYDSNFFHIPTAEDGVAPVQALNGYAAGSRLNGPGSGVVSNVVDTINGVGRVTIEGYYLGTNPAPAIDQNTIAVTFLYNASDTSATETILRVTPQGNDYMKGLDPENGNAPVFFDASHIIPSDTGFFAHTFSPTMSGTPHDVNADPAPTPDLVVTSTTGGVAVLDYVYSGRGTRLIQFADPIPGEVQIALKFSEDAADGGAGDISALIALLNLQAPDPAFGTGYDAMFTVFSTTDLLDFNFDNIFTSVRITSLAARMVPEPSAMALLGAVALPMMRRRR